MFSKENNISMVIMFKFIRTTLLLELKMDTWNSIEYWLLLKSRKNSKENNKEKFSI